MTSDERVTVALFALRDLLHGRRRRQGNIRVSGFGFMASGFPYLEEDGDGGRGREPAHLPRGRPPLPDLLLPMRSGFRVPGSEFRVQVRTAVERIWHMSDSQGQILNMAWLSCKSPYNFPSHGPRPRSNEYGTYKTVKARFGPRLGFQVKVLTTFQLVPPSLSLSLVLPRTSSTPMPPLARSPAPRGGKR